MCQETWGLAVAGRVRPLHAPDWNIKERRRCPPERGANGKALFARNRAFVTFTVGGAGGWSKGIRGRGGYGGKGILRSPSFRMTTECNRRSFDCV